MNVTPHQPNKNHQKTKQKNKTVVSWSNDISVDDPLPEYTLGPSVSFRSHESQDDEEESRISTPSLPTKLPSSYNYETSVPFATTPTTTSSISSSSSANHMVWKRKQHPRRSSRTGSGTVSVASSNPSSSTSTTTPTVGNSHKPTNTSSQTPPPKNRRWSSRGRNGGRNGGGGGDGNASDASGSSLRRRRQQSSSKAAASSLVVLEPVSPRRNNNTTNANTNNSSWEPFDESGSAFAGTTNGPSWQRTANTNPPVQERNPKASFFYPEQAPHRRTSHRTLSHQPQEDDDQDDDDRPLYETPYKQPQQQQPSQGVAATTPSTTASSFSTASTTTPTSSSHASPGHRRTYSGTSSTSSASTPMMPLTSTFVASTTDRTDASVTTSSSQSQQSSVVSSSDVSHLLTPPVPEDRSERRRLAYESQKRQKAARSSTFSQGSSKSGSRSSVYDGELEPEGVRGQEAEPVPVSSTSSLSSNLPNLRTFGPSSSSTNGGTSGNQVTLLLTPMSSSSKPVLGSGGGRDAMRSPPPPPPPTTPPSSSLQWSPVSQWPPQEDEDDDATNRNHNNTGNAPPPHSPSRPSAMSHRKTMAAADSSSSSSTRQTPTRPLHHASQSRPKPILRNSVATYHRQVVIQAPPSPNSTSSDEMLEEMRSDLMPPPEETDEQQNETRNTTTRTATTPTRSTRSAALSPRSPSHHPSTVAAAAAEAAARALEQGDVRQGPAPTQWPDDNNNNHQSLSPSRRKPSNGNDQQQQPEEDDDDEEPFDVDEWNRLAMQNVEQGHYEQALARFTRVLEWQTAQHGPLHPAVASAHHNLGTVHAKRASAAPDDSVVQQEAHKLALHSFQAAARTARDSLSPQHPNVAVSLVRIGFLLLQSKQYDNAVVTFREALRIRQLAYGPKHALVANLYNNLGVCQMHLGDFEQGKQDLEHALEIQRELFVLNDNATAHSNTSASVNTTLSSASKLTQSLEIADTLFNIGGLCLEWIRKRGHDLRRQQDAEAAFEEALLIRTDVLGPQDALTIQVRDLLAMTQSIPKPRPLSSGSFDGTNEKALSNNGYEMEMVDPEEVLSVESPVVPKSRSEKTTPERSSRRARSSSRERPETPPDFADRVMGQLTTHPPDTSDRYSIPIAPEPNTPNSRQRSRPVTPVSQTEGVSPHNGLTIVSPRPSTPNSASRSTSMNSPSRSRSGTPSRMSRSGTKSPGTPTSPRKRRLSSTTPQSLSEASLSPGRQIFCGKGSGKTSLEARTLSTGSSTVNSSSVKSPSVSVSRAPSTPSRSSRDAAQRSIFVTLSTEQEEEDDDVEKLETTAKSPGSRNDRMFQEFRDLDGVQLSDMYSGGGNAGGTDLQRTNSNATKPLQSERSRRNRANDYPPPVSVVNVRSTGEELEVSTRGTKVFVRQHHVPLSPDRPDHHSRNTTSDAVAMEDSGDPTDETDRSPLPQNTYPFDTEENCLIGDAGIDSEYGRVHIPSTWAKAGLVLDEDDPDQRQREIMVTRPSRISDSSRSPERRLSREPPKDRERTSSPREVREYDTGNKERDEIMRRAKAFIEAYKQMEKTDNDPSSLMRTESTNEDTNVTESDSVEDSLQAEDGLAKLGGDWISSPSRRQCTMEEMQSSPKTFLPEIYEEACIRLKRDDVDGALPLFNIILECQKERYGAVHEHTASALYNLGIAHLRVQHGEEALEAFEEATQVRRALLGREHPSIAVTLVKVGITNLLLHRFEEALWNFREALSVRKRALGPLHPSTARIYNNIGCVHVEFNELREARRAFETALEIQRNALSDDPDSRGIMLATATTLCNLGYLYRHRELHGKAALVLKEAADLQEQVLGRSNPSVLSTLDCLADSSASGGQTTDALRYFNMILTRYRVGGAPGSQTVLRAEAVLLYKMSRVHRQRNDRESQLDTLKLALRSVRALADAGPTRKDALERRIVYDMRSCREHMDKNKMKWI